MKNWGESYFELAQMVELADFQPSTINHQPSTINPFLMYPK